MMKFIGTRPRPEQTDITDIARRYASLEIQVLDILQWTFFHLATCTSDGVSHMWNSLRITLCELHIVDHKLALSLVHELIQFAEVRNEYFE